MVRPRPPLSANAARRLAFARKWVRNGARKAQQIVFSDEHIVSTHNSPSRAGFVVTDETDITSNVVIWAAIGHNWRSPLVILPKTASGGFRHTSKWYVSRCLRRVKSHLQRPDVILLQDGARCHWGENVTAFFERNSIAHIPDFPPASPDLNPIDQLWLELDRRIAEHRPESEAELKEIAARVWEDEIDQSTINAHVRSFTNACKKVVQNRGK